MALPDRMFTRRTVSPASRHPGEELFVQIVGLFGLSRKTADEVEPGEQFRHVVPPHAAFFIHDPDRPENFIWLCLEVISRYHYGVSSFHTKRGDITRGMIPYDCTQCLTALVFVLRDCRRVRVVNVQGF